MNGKRRCLYSLVCCFALSLAAGPSPARPTIRLRASGQAAKHRKGSYAAGRQAGGSATGFSYWHPRGLLPNTKNADVNSYCVRYVPPRGKSPACAVVSMHLDSYDEIQDGNGSFGGQTPRGPVRVVWQRRWQTLERDEQGRSVPSEFSDFPFYTLTIDSPETLPIRLETQQYELYAVRLNGRLIPLGPSLSGEKDLDGPSDARHFSYTFPGGHSVLTLRMGVFWFE